MTTTDLQLVTERHPDGVVVIAARGELSAQTGVQLRTALLAETHQGARMVVDLAEVEFVDSVGLGVLVGGLKRIKERDGQMVLADLHPNVVRIFRITRLDHLFTVFPDVGSVTWVDS
jgi:anti-sigma B factor antagonist